MKKCGWISKTLHWVKKPILKKLHTVWLHCVWHSWKDKMISTGNTSVGLGLRDSAAKGWPEGSLRALWLWWQLHKSMHVLKFTELYKIRKFLNAYYHRRVCGGGGHE
jgi:hypothetical protein